jgi:uncharacterized Tic20 family protein
VVNWQLKEKTLLVTIRSLQMKLLKGLLGVEVKKCDGSVLCLSCSSRTFIFLSKWSEKLWCGGTCDICSMLKQDFDCPSWVSWMTKSTMNICCFLNSADENADYMSTVESLFLFDCWICFIWNWTMSIWSWLIFYAWSVEEKKCTEWNQYFMLISLHKMYPLHIPITVSILNIHSVVHHCNHFKYPVWVAFEISIELFCLVSTLIWLACLLCYVLSISTSRIISSVICIRNIHWVILLGIHSHLVGMFAVLRAIHLSIQDNIQWDMHSKYPLS